VLKELILLVLGANLLPAQRIHVRPQEQSWKLLYAPEAEYPRRAAEFRIRGTVKLAAIIGKDGRVMRLVLVSGHPLLVNAAMDAARLYRYRPTLIGDRPVEVSTHIYVQVPPARLQPRPAPERDRV
jgi:protein TonB